MDIGLGYVSNSAAPNSGGWYLGSFDMVVKVISESLDV
jgi:hypothetical protein